jgi:integrase
MTQNNMRIEGYTEEDWLDRMYRKSNSTRTRRLAITSLHSFELFCKHQNMTKQEMITKYQNWYNQPKPDIRSICLSLDKYVKFLDTDDETILLPSISGLKFKRKSAKSIRAYFSFIKSYLRLCHDVKISSEDIADYVQFPTTRKESRKPISLEQLKKIMNNASPKRRALYYVLVTSGIRLGEALTLRKSNFHTKERPVRITLDAENTKTKESRETYITIEAYEKVKPILEGKKSDDLVFCESDDLDLTVQNEDHRFAELRNKLGFIEKYKNSNRHVVNIHAFRAYFHTKASQKHGEEYANALDGHSGYLKQYYREDPKERAKKYAELEPRLFIEVINLKEKVAKDKDQKIQNLESIVEKLQAKMLRIELLNQ